MRWLAVLLLALSFACGGVPKQVAKEPDTERTWWELCWMKLESGLEVPLYPDETYPYSPACDSPEQINWPGSQLRYQIEAEKYRPLVTAAAKQWNEWIGREVFVETDDDVADIVVYTKELWPGIAGQAQHYKELGRLKAQVLLSPTLVRPYRTILHEFGHVLGFAHDRDKEGSIMYPSGEGGLALTTKDYVALRRKYGGSAVSRRFTKNIKMEDLACRCGVPVPAKFYDNAKEISERLEKLMERAGRVKILSGYRTRAYNRSVGGAPHSYHLTASAVDIRSYELSPQELKGVYEELIKEGVVPDGGIGLYKFHVHIDLGKARRWVDVEDN